MAEEKKEEVQKPAVDAAQKPVEQAAPGAEPKTDVKAEAAPAPKPAEAKKAEPKVEKPANCASCNKSIKNKRWYYRNGKYYCSKRCWQTASKKAKAPAAETAPQQ